jgi:hypothetical protein
MTKDVGTGGGRNECAKVLFTDNVSREDRGDGLKDDA